MEERAAFVITVRLMAALQLEWSMFAKFYVWANTNVASRSIGVERQARLRTIVSASR